MAEQSKADFRISNMGLNRVSGTIQGMKGDVQFNANDLANSSFRVCVDPATVATGINKRDEHLRNEDFFSVASFANICFYSKTIKADGDGYLAQGTLTMLGVSQEVEIPFTYSDKTFSGTLSLNRLDYGLGEGTSTFAAGNEVAVTITCVVD
ncbi:MAG: YceI family protein [Bacteroidota bacterium]